MSELPIQFQVFGVFMLWLFVHYLISHIGSFDKIR